MILRGSQTALCIIQGKTTACVRGGGRGYQNGGPPFANLSPRLCLFSDHLRTVLPVNRSLPRAQQRRALDGSGPFLTTLLRRGKGSLRTALLVGHHFAAILVPFFAATDKWAPFLLPAIAPVAKPLYAGVHH